MLCMPKQGNSCRTFVKFTESGQSSSRLGRCQWNYGNRDPKKSLNAFRARWCIDIAYVCSSWLVLEIKRKSWCL
jgi:hypothetical protein